MRTIPVLHIVAPESFKEANACPALYHYYKGILDTKNNIKSVIYLYPVIFPRFYPSTLSHMQQTPSPCSQPHTHKNKGTLLHNYSVIIKFRNFHNDTLSDINPILILCQLPYCCPCCHLYFPIQGHIQH